MKKFFMVAAIAAMCVFNCDAQSFKKEGNNYYTSSRTSVAKDSIITDFNWNNYTIIVRKEDGYAWVGKISKKSGKYYRTTVPEDVAKDVCKQIGIPYTYVKKSKSTKK